MESRQRAALSFATQHVIPEFDEISFAYPDLCGIQSEADFLNLFINGANATNISPVFLQSSIII